MIRRSVAYLVASVGPCLIGACAPEAPAAEGVWARSLDELDVHYAVLYDIGGGPDDTVGP